MNRRSLLDSFLEQVSQAYESLGDAVTIVDTNNRLVYVNSAYEKLFGYTKSELIGEPLSLVIPTGHFVVTEAMVRAAPNQRWEGEVVRVRKGGERFPARLAIALLKNTEGEVVGTAGIVTDLTERKQAEERANQLGDIQKVLANIGRIISSSLDINEVYGRFALEVMKLIPFDRITVNEANVEQGLNVVTYQAGIDAPERRRREVFTLDGTTVGHVVLTRQGLLLNEADLANVNSDFPGLVPAMKAGMKSFITVPLVSNNRVFGALVLKSHETNVYSETHLRLAEQIADQIAGAIANSQLYKERQRALEALKETEEKYRALVENANDAIVVLQEGKIVYRNPMLERVLGYTLDESGEQGFLDLVAPEDRERVHGYYQQRLRGEDAPDQYDVSLVTRDGQRVVMEVKPRIIEYGGRPAKLVVMHDVTERNQLQQQLLHSQKMEAIGTLAGGVAHDFNNMLSAIMSYTQLASAKAPSDGPVIGYLEEVQKAAERSADLTRQLLAFSRQHIAKPRILNLNRILTDIEKMLRRLISEDIELVTETDERLGSVMADPGQLEQVLVNLVVNARDAMPNGGRLIIETANDSLDESFVSQYPDLVAGDYVTLCISDTGVGMTEEIRSRIFEPFFTTKEVDQGTGLGLSTCYGIVSQIGGCIMVESEPDHGSTFKIYLPRVFEDSVDVHDSNASGNLPTGSERVLVVEDEPLLRKVTADVLRELGYTVLEGESGEDALALAVLPDAGLIDLLVTDLIMPGMGGKVLAARIKQLHSGAKILYTSGYTNDSRIHQEVSQEGTEFMPKPFTPTTLANTVRRLLDGE